MSSGDLDKTFNRPNGFLTKQFFPGYESFGTSSVLDSNGNVYVTGTAFDDKKVGNMFIAKYKKNGTLDNNFANGAGYVIKQFFTGYESSGNSLVLDSDGNIYTTGSALDANSKSYYFIAKYDIYGNLDNKFAGGVGYIVNRFGNRLDSYGRSIALDGSGNIYIAYNFDGKIGTNIGLEEYNSYGASVDTGVFPNAAAQTGELLDQASASAIIIDSTGNIYIAGSLNDYAVLLKYNKPPVGYIGTFDYSKLQFFDGYFSTSHSLALDSNRNIIVTGTASDSVGNSYMALAKYKPTLELDTTFGNGTGYIVKRVNNNDSFGVSSVLDSSNNIYVSQYVYYGTTLFLYLSLYNSDGIINKNFGNDGYAYQSLGNFDQTGFTTDGCLNLDSDNNIYFTGYDKIKGNTTRFMYLAKFLGNPNREPICLPAGTPIVTDKGIVPIEKIDITKHTINGISIVAITKTITPEKNLICFEKNSIAINCPNQRTLMTPGHCVAYKGKLIQAKEFVGRLDGVHTVPYNGKDILYNVLMDGHYLMNVNGMILETLHPENKVAKNILTFVHIK